MKSNIEIHPFTEGHGNSVKQFHPDEEEEDDDKSVSSHGISQCTDYCQNGDGKCKWVWLENNKLAGANYCIYGDEINTKKYISPTFKKICVSSSESYLEPIVNKEDPGDMDLGLCEGNCNSDDDCRGDLECFNRKDDTETVPGCFKTGYTNSGDNGRHNYCYDPSYEPPLVVMGDNTLDTEGAISLKVGDDGYCSENIPSLSSSFPGDGTVEDCKTACKNDAKCTSITWYDAKDNKTDFSNLCFLNEGSKCTLKKNDSDEYKSSVYKKQRKLGMCQGYCDNDEDCSGDLKCNHVYPTNVLEDGITSVGTVSGCSGRGIFSMDYKYCS